MTIFGGYMIDFGHVIILSFILLCEGTPIMDIGISSQPLWMRAWKIDPSPRAYRYNKYTIKPGKPLQSISGTDFYLFGL